MAESLSFGRLLRRRRRALDLTQDELARRVGCALPTIKKFEADERRPSRALAERLARFLDVPADQVAEFVRCARATLPDSPAPPTPVAARPMRNDLAALPGTQLRDYIIREQIGLGGFGAVFRAEQPSVGRAVAIKVIQPQFADRPDFIRRFEAEGQTIARLEHPNIVPLYDFWREPGGAYLVMRLLVGGTLHTQLQRGPLVRQAAERLRLQICSALTHAHQRQIVHRDLKPANILLEERGNYYLADFGIAKDLDEAVPLTTPGIIAGSPAYLSPEQLRAEPVSPQTDIYSLGLVLYEALTGVRPFAGSTPAELIQQQLSATLPPLSTRRPDLPRTLDAVLWRATAKQPAERYPDSASLAAAFAAAWSPRAAPATITLDLPDNDNPYLGLRAFGEADATRFFGRTGLVQRLLERFAEAEEFQQEVGGQNAAYRHDRSPQPAASARFLAVVGPSGSGKSSVVRAGLLPALRRGGVPGSERWFIAELTPGAHPLDELELALLRVAPTASTGLRAQLERDARGLARAARLVLPDDRECELVLLVDQFEELFTLTQSLAAREQMLALLATAVSDPRSRVRVLVTLRADFYDRPLQHPQLGPLIQASTEVILPLTADERAEAIAGPARLAGLALEPGLIERIEGDVAAQPGALPLLQYALTELFVRRQGRALTSAAYQASGGVAGALAQRAEGLFGQLNPAQQRAAQQVFLRLIVPGEGADDTRRRVRVDELAAIGMPLASGLETGPRARHTDASLHSFAPVRPIDTVLERFGTARLLTFDHDPRTRAPTVELAHEALIRTWSRLHEWIETSREMLRVQRRLAAEAAEWERSGQLSSYLASGARLGHYESLADQPRLEFTPTERAFVQAGVAAREQQRMAEQERQTRELDTQRRAARRLRSLAVVLTLFLLVATSLSAYALQQRSEAERQRQAALSNAATAQAERQRAEDTLARSEAQRLAAEASTLMQAHGSPELSALLSIRSLHTRATPQGDAALAAAALLTYPRQALLANAGQVLALAYTPDGASILTTHQDGTARLWDARRGTPLLIFAGHSEAVLSVAVAPDGHSAITGSADGTVQLWDPRTGQSLRRLEAHAGEVNAVALSADGRWALSGGTDGVARLWDLRTGAVLQTLDGGGLRVVGVAFSPDGRMAATVAEQPEVTLWDVASGQRIRRISYTGPLLAVAFAPDGQTLLTGASDQSAQLWDVHSGTLLRRLVGHSSLLTTVAFSPDGMRALTAAQDSTARLWDVQSGQELRQFAANATVVGSAAFSPDGSQVATGAWNGVAQIWDANTRHTLPLLIGHTATVNSARFSPDGRYLLTCGDRSAILWDARTGQEVRRLVGHTAEVARAVFSPDGRAILTGSIDHTAIIWETSTGRQLRVLRGHADALQAVAYAPDGRLVLTGSIDATARLWDVETGEQRLVLHGHTAKLVSVDFSPDGHQLLTSSLDGSARLWDAQTGKQLRVLLDRTDGMTVASFAPDSQTIATGTVTGSVKLWDSASGKLLRTFTGHSDLVWGIAFSPDGRLLLTGSKDTTARLWDVQHGTELRRLVGHRALLGPLGFSPGGKQVITSSDDGTARIWDVDLRDAIRSLCGRLLRDFTPEERAAYGISDAGPTCAQS